jgi:outer membrane protein assembly factor BamD
MHHHPDTSAATKVGDPSLIDPPQTSAVTLVRNANATLAGPSTVKSGSGNLGIETTGTGPAPANDAVPRSDNGATAPETTAPVETGSPTPTSPSTSEAAPSTGPGPATSEATAPASAAPQPAPARVNDAAVDTTQSSSSSITNQTAPATAQSSSSSDSTPSADSSSKKKKKKGLKKLNPF